jgi:hypothetical protein
VTPLWSTCETLRSIPGFFPPTLHKRERKDDVGKSVLNEWFIGKYMEVFQKG